MSLIESLKLRNRKPTVVVTDGYGHSKKANINGPESTVEMVPTPSFADLGWISFWIIVALSIGLFIFFGIPKIYARCRRRKRAFKRRALKPRRLRTEIDDEIDEIDYAGGRNGIEIKELEPLLKRININNNNNSIEANEQQMWAVDGVGCNSDTPIGTVTAGDFLLVPARPPLLGTRKVRLVERCNGDLVMQEEKLDCAGKTSIVTIVYPSSSNILESMYGNMQYAVALCRTLQNSARAQQLEVGLYRIKNRVKYLTVPTVDRGRIPERRPICERHGQTNSRRTLSENARKTQEVLAMERVLRTPQPSPPNRNLQVPKVVKTLCPRHSPILNHYAPTYADSDYILAKRKSPNGPKGPTETPLEAQRLLDYALRPNPKLAAAIRARQLARSTCPRHSRSLVATEPRKTTLKMDSNGNSVIINKPNGCVEHANIECIELRSISPVNKPIRKDIPQILEPLSIECNTHESTVPSFHSTATCCATSNGPMRADQLLRPVFPLEPVIIDNKMGWSTENTSPEFAKVDNSVELGLETPILDSGDSDDDDVDDRNSLDYSVKSRYSTYNMYYSSGSIDDAHSPDLSEPEQDNTNLENSEPSQQELVTNCSDPLNKDTLSKTEKSSDLQEEQQILTDGNTINDDFDIEAQVTVDYTVQSGYSQLGTLGSNTEDVDSNLSWNSPDYV